MKKLFLLLLLILVAANCNSGLAQEPPIPDFDDEMELDSVQSERELPFPQIESDEDGAPLPPPMPEESDWEGGLAEPEFAPQETESPEVHRDAAPEGEVWHANARDMEPPSRSRSKPFRHLSELPGQYRGDWLQLVKMKYVWKEVELVNEQRMAIHKVSQKMKKLSREILRDQTEKVGLPHEQPDAADELQESLTQLRSDAVTEIQEEILLPEQVQRLKEIDFQLKVKSRGIVATLKDEDLGLNVSEDQIEDIEARAKELVEEYDLLMRSFKIDFKKQILAELDAKQRSKVESLMGAEMQVMEDEGDETMTVTTKLKEAALEKLQQWRDKQ